MSLSNENRLFLTMITKDMNHPNNPENSLFLGEKKAEFSSQIQKKPLYGFSFEEHGVMVYNLLEGCWLVVGDYEATNLNPKDWFYSIFSKAVECIPRKDCIISWIHLENEILTEKEKKLFLQKNSSLKLLAYSDSTKKRAIQIAIDQAKEHTFEGLEFETFKNHVLVRGYKNIKELSAPFIYSI